MKRMVVAAALVLSFGTAAAYGRPEGVSEEDAELQELAKKQLSKAVISLADAVRIALRRVPDSRAVEAELYLDDDELDFVVEVIAGGKHREVTVNAKTGNFTSADDESEETGKEHKLEEAVAKANISLHDAIDVAMKKVPKGQPFQISPAMEDGKLVYEVELLVGDKVKEVAVDPDNGDVVYVEDVTAD